MNDSLDRLYELLPVIYRQRDAEQGQPLRALLQIITEQVNVVESDIAQLYENWFIETCQDWVVPYIGDLVGYTPIHEGEESEERTTVHHKILIPRREVANTIRYRQRKGTLAVLELLAKDVAGWPARVVEFYRLLGFTQHVNHVRLMRGRTVDLRYGDALDRLNGPFDELAHTVNVRHITSHHTPGDYNIPNVGLFVWRLKSYSVTQTPAYCLESIGEHCYSFSVLSNDTPLYTHPKPEGDPTEIASELNVPTPIRRRAFELYKTDYYGEDKSLQIWIDSAEQPILPENIIVADLSNWQYLPTKNQVAIDPELGRIAFPSTAPPKQNVWVYYHYGFSANIGGGEYQRSLPQPADVRIYRVGEKETIPNITEALKQWQVDQKDHAIIEIIDSGVYVEPINIKLKENQTLQLRAANRTRPVIRLLDWKTSGLDDLRITGATGSCFILDGLLISGRGIRIEGKMVEVVIRHTTLVPGWEISSDCKPCQPVEPSLKLINTEARIRIEQSIIGAIQVSQDEVNTDPVAISISDSILDATHPNHHALSAPPRSSSVFAHAVVTLKCSTVFGQIHTHAIDLAENSIFMGLIQVARRQRGCLRFCYVTPGSRTPRRYRCQPDLVIEQAKEVTAAVDQNKLTDAQQREQSRVVPQFNSVHYGTPAYCQLARCCAEEIKRGAEDESEMGVFHHLFQPQREANLQTRLEEYTPAGMETGIIYAS
ncbi:MAG: hypothetical protein HC877_13035 [Thioploca sp.]|nr:hypothetical protein [Thioploca sp.]